MEMQQGKVAPRRAGQARAEPIRVKQEVVVGSEI